VEDLKMFFDDPYETIEEGPVSIEFEESKRGKIKINFIVDFGETDLSSDRASAIFRSIVANLRAGLGVSLSKCK